MSGFEQSRLVVVGPRPRLPYLLLVVVTLLGVSRSLSSSLLDPGGVGVANRCHQKGRAAPIC
eukprot:7972832-Lingulodinium_polyedra.AAC.1